MRGVTFTLKENEESGMISWGMTLIALVAVLGAYVYQASKILMKGSIFQRMRSAIAERANEEFDYFSLRRRSVNFFFSKLHDMLGCMLCTSTEVAIWSIGVPFLIYGCRIHLWSRVSGVALPFWSVEVPGMVLASFVVALGVAGLGQGFHEIVEHRPQRFVALRNEAQAEIFALRSELDKARVDIAEIQQALGEHRRQEEADPRLALPNLLEFREIYRGIMQEGYSIGCPYSRATHRLRVLDSLIRDVQPLSRHLIALSQILNACISRQNEVFNLVLRQGFPEEVYAALSRACDEADNAAAVIVSAEAPPPPSRWA